MTKEEKKFDVERRKGMEGEKRTVTVGATAFEVMEVIRNGNREVLRVREQDGRVRIVKILGRQKPLELKVAAEQARYIELYRQELLKLGIPLPEKTELSFAINGAGIELREVSPDVGTEVSSILVDPKLGPRVVDQILEKVMKPLFASSKGAVLEIGLDPLTRNFTYNGSGELNYVDLFPAKITIGGRKTLEFPEPTDQEARALGLFRHYHKKGIMLVFFMDLCRYAPALREVWRSKVYTFLQCIGEQRVVRFLEASPAAHLSKDNAIRVIQKERGRGISYFFLRDIACEIAFWERRATPRLEEFFQLTHFQDRPLSAEQIRRAKQFLCEWASTLC